MAPQRGRKCQITEAQFVSIIERYRDQLVEDDHLVNRYDPIWSQLEECASKMGACLKASSFHTHVHGNRYNVKTDILLLDNNTVDRYKTLEFDASDTQDPSYKAADLSSDDQRVTFDFSISCDEMKAITEFRPRNRSKGGKRMWHVFKSGLYQDFFVNKIFGASRLRCGFNFQRTYIDMSGTSGNLKATCRCRAKLTILLGREVGLQDWTATCSYAPGHGKCGKPYLRGAIRQKIAEKLEHVPIECFRAQQAGNLMTQDDDPEPPIIRKPDVLYQAKHEALAKKYLHPDPIQALVIMKKEGCFGSIGEIGHDPFYVHYSTNVLTHSYKKMHAEAERQGKKLCLAIDSTGGLVHPLGSKHIFLHAIAIGIPEGQISLWHMLSESSHTETICHWLKMWRREKIPIPHTCVVDWSKALLHGTASGFTSAQTIEEYVNKMPEVEVYIRLDVAHTIHKYARFFKNYRKVIKNLLMASVGELLLSESKLQAQHILRNILLLCLTPTTGRLPTGEKSPSAVAYDELTELISAGGTLSYEELADTVQGPRPGQKYYDQLIDNPWYRWGQEMKKEVLEYINSFEEGDAINAFYEDLDDSKNFVSYLLKDISLFPLWSNVHAAKFGVPAKNPSSACVEQVFRKIKHTALSVKLPVRVDVFVQEHLKYLNGKVRQIDDAIVVNAQGRELADPNETSTEMAVVDEIEEPEMDDSERIPPSTVHYLKDDPQEPLCTTCKKPAGNHVCQICENKVHAIPGCSFGLGDEGYAQKRICIACQDKPDNQNILALQAMENWKNLAVKNQTAPEKRTRGKENKIRKSKKSLYLGGQRSTIRDRILLKKTKSIPVMKNGNCCGPITHEKKEIHVTNTCGIDSILQVLLAHAHDDEFFAEKVKEWASRSLLFTLVHQIKEHGITSHSYVLRGRTLLEAYNEEIRRLIPFPGRANVYTLNCTDSISNLVDHVFTEQFSSYFEVQKCSNGCPDLIKGYGGYSVLHHLLVSMNWSEILNDCCRVGKIGRCSQGTCSSTRINMHTIGDLVFFYGLSVGRDDTVALKDIPEIIVYDETRNLRLQIIGVVDFRIRRGCLNENEIGHYTAYSLRKDKRWINYDGLPVSEKIASARTVVNPALIITKKIEN